MIKERGAGREGDKPMDDAWLLGVCGFLHGHFLLLSIIPQITPNPKSKRKHCVAYDLDFRKLPSRTRPTTKSSTRVSSWIISSKHLLGNLHTTGCRSCTKTSESWNFLFCSATIIFQRYLRTKVSMFLVVEVQRSRICVQFIAWFMFLTANRWPDL